MPTYYSLLKSKYRSVMEKDAMSYLVTDLLDYKLHGESKQKTIISSYTEEHTNKFVPSMFYTFLYTSSFFDTGANKPFMDVVPLILCTDVGISKNNAYIKGINFNFIPNNIRAIFLDRISDAFPEYRIGSDSTGKVNPKAVSFFANNEDLMTFLDYIKNITKYDISRAVRTYSSKYIENARMIEPTMWKYIPFLNFQDAVRGIQLSEVQKEIIKNTKT